MPNDNPKTSLSRRRFLQGVGASAGLISAPAYLESGRTRTFPGPRDRVERLRFASR